MGVVSKSAAADSSAVVAGLCEAGNVPLPLPLAKGELEGVPTTASVPLPLPLAKGE
jgi:hypothetical protein